MKPRRSVAAGLGLVVVACALLAWWPRTAPVSAVVLAPAGMPRPDAVLPQPTAAAVPTDAARARGDEPQGGPVFDERNLFSLFQLALSSDDPAVMAEGIAAWRSCAGYLGAHVDDWLNLVMPEGLTVQERERRAQRGRASARRCTGFAGQPDTRAQAEALIERARDAGSAMEQLRTALIARAGQDEGDRTPLAALACATLGQHATQPRAVRMIGSVLQSAARSRTGHPLNTVPFAARGIAIHLAYCTLDPEGCDAHSNYVGSACMQQGRCDYTREEDYWRESTEPQTYAAALALHDVLVDTVQRGDCRALFE